MAENIYHNVGENFDLNGLVARLAESYQHEGFRVTSCPMTSGISVTFEKNKSGLKKFLGLSQVITVNCSINKEGTLLVNFTNADWGSKAFAIAVGWFLFWIPFATGLYGAYKQSELPKEINQKIDAIINGYGIRI